MRRTIITIVIIIVIALALALLIEFLQPMPTSGASAQALRAASSSIATTAVTASAPSVGGMDPAITAAIITGVIAFIGIAISAEVSLYLFKRTRELEREKILLEDKVADERRKAMLRARTLEARIAVYRKALRSYALRDRKRPGLS